MLEHVNGELKIHANPLGVIKNPPTFDWHMTNLSNYVNKTVSNVPMIDVGGQRSKALVKAVECWEFLGISRRHPASFGQSPFPRVPCRSKTAKAGVLQAFHILNQFDIPKGSARGIEHGREVADYTLWTSAADLKNLRYYYRDLREQPHPHG